MRKKILIMGLPVAGKTTLARHLASRLNAVHYNADDVRANVNRDLGFSEVRSRRARPGFVIWIDRIQAGAFEDTNRMFVPPDHYDLRVTANGAPEYWTEQVMELLRPISTTHSAFHWPLPALSRWASGFDRRGSQACRSSLCSGSRHPRDRREEPL